MHDQIWKASGKFKVNLVAQCLMIEYLLGSRISKKELKKELEKDLIRISKNPSGI